MHRTGRDLPGSNWHFYPPDPDGHTNELYYGIEQIGWDGLSKPDAMHKIRYREPPQLPHKSEYGEVMGALDEKVDLDGRIRHREDGGTEEIRRRWRAARAAVQDRADRPGAPVRRRHRRARSAFYRDELGLQVTEEVVWQGHRCVFLRANTEHHSLALYPKALRAELGLSRAHSR